MGLCVAHAQAVSLGFDHIIRHLVNDFPDRIGRMVVHLAEELIKAFLSDKCTQTFVPDHLMHYRIIYIGYIAVVGKYDHNLTGLTVPPAFGPTFPPTVTRLAILRQLR